MIVHIDRPYGHVTLKFEAYEEDGRNVCGIEQLEGRIGLPAKAWLRIVREEVANIERLAAKAGCSELRIAGRDWSRVLPDYEPFDGPRNGIRKVL